MRLNYSVTTLLKYNSCTIQFSVLIVGYSELFNNHHSQVLNIFIALPAKTPHPSALHPHPFIPLTPAQPLIYFLYLQTRLFWIFFINRSIFHVVFCDRLLALIIFSRIIYVLACINQYVIFFIAEKYSNV